MKAFFTKVVDVWYWAVYWGSDPGCLSIIIGLLGIILVLVLDR